MFLVLDLLTGSIIVLILYLLNSIFSWEEKELFHLIFYLH